MSNDRLRIARIGAPEFFAELTTSQLRENAKVLAETAQRAKAADA